MYCNNNVDYWIPWMEILAGNSMVAMVAVYSLLSLKQYILHASYIHIAAFSNREHQQLLL